eukprot:TRINITY_DN13514_c0_g1_i1.p1 TRINITY_DN13514_c0_g1~~TRINITY_DN13514_c0_g1_i1.p1  ORF type:complete len:342 (+),score=46.50 TRINITY_DN13514_c0_g1_i1:174-1199(+)
MLDIGIYGNEKYTLPAHDGPQCPGLLADFVYLGPGLHIGVADLQEAARWYASLPLYPPRTDPPIAGTPDYMNELHALDQFALNLAIAEAVVPKGHLGCFPLHHSRYLHVGLGPRPGVADTEAEVVHDKTVSSCGAGSFDRCQRQNRAFTSLENIVPLNTPHQFSQRTEPPSIESKRLLSTLNSAEELLTPAAVHPCADRQPSYAVYANDRTCGHAAVQLHLDLSSRWLSASRDVRLINLDAPENLVLGNNRQPPMGLDLGAQVFETLRRSAAVHSGTVLRSNWPLLGLAISFAARPDELSVLAQQVNRSDGLHLLDQIFFGPHDACMEAVIFFWFNGDDAR